MEFLVSFIPTLIVGISLGSLYGLVALAYTIIINATQLVNFAQGDFAMVGVVFAWVALSFLGFPVWLAIIIAIIAGALIGFLTERIMVTPLMKRGGSSFSPILGTMAVGMIAEGAVGYYTNFFWMPINYFFGMQPWRVGKIPVDTQGALIIITTIVLVIGYWFILNKTLPGLALRASGFNRTVSMLLGIQITRMVALAFIISGSISGLAGVLCAPLSAFTALEGMPLAINGFIALIIGGWGNPYAAVLGGVTLGLMRALLTGYFSSAHAEISTFVILILVLTLKPDGLFSRLMLPKGERKPGL
jgi:branched-chain amino acid transport system permease protein